MTKVRWHKRSETKISEDRNKDISVFSLEDTCQYQSFVHKNVQLFVTESAIHSLKSHLSQDTTKETGGILVGKISFDSKQNKYYTEITGAIAAPTTIGTPSTFRFTPQCWTAILKEQTELYPETQIVGWYHSHPNFGVFLSGVDLDTQKVCFNQPWHIAIVYDPIREQIGFFCGAEGKRMTSVKTGLSEVKELESSQETDGSNQQYLAEEKQKETQYLSNPSEINYQSFVENLALNWSKIIRFFLFIYLRRS